MPARGATGDVSDFPDRLSPVFFGTLQEVGESTEWLLAKNIVGVLIWAVQSPSKIIKVLKYLYN